MRTDYNSLIVTVADGIVDVVINRPDARNALTFEIVGDFDTILQEAMEDDDVKVVMVRGAGKVFSAGGDLVEAAEHYMSTGRLSRRRPHDPPSLRQAWYFTKPLIAGVHGFVGPEAQIILGYFDFIIAAEGTRFSFEQLRVSAGGLGGEPLAMQLPMRVWKKLQMMGGWFDAEQAHDLHLVQRVVAVDDLEAETRRWAEQLARLPSEQIQFAKISIHRQYELMGLVNMESVQNRIFGHPPTKENMAWWLEMLKGGVKPALSSRNEGFDNEVARL